MPRPYHQILDPLITHLLQAQEAVDRTTAHPDLTLPVDLALELDDLHDDLLLMTERLHRHIAATTGPTTP